MIAIVLFLRIMCNEHKLSKQFLELKPQKKVI